MIAGQFAEAKRREADRREGDAVRLAEYNQMAGGMRRLHVHKGSACALYGHASCQMRHELTGKPIANIGRKAKNDIRWTIKALLSNAYVLMWLVFKEVPSPGMHRGVV